MNLNLFGWIPELLQQTNPCNLNGTVRYYNTDIWAKLTVNWKIFLHPDREIIFPADTHINALKNTN